MNHRKKTHCPQGHEYTEENKVPNGAGFRCKICNRSRYVKRDSQAKSPEVRFWEKVDKTPGFGPKGECWKWTGVLVGFGYGQIRDKDSVTQRAHRFSYELANGGIPTGLLVRHKCDNPACVNPAHLELGTHKDNAQDMAQRGRAAGQRKTHCPHGHEYTAGNTFVDAGKRKCKMCARLLQQRRNAKKRELCATI